MSEINTLVRETEDLPPIPAEWIDLAAVATGLDVLDREGEVALVFHMPQGAAAIGVSFDVQGAVALIQGLTEAVERAAVVGS